MFTHDDLNYIELFLASDIKLVRYQVTGMLDEPKRVHNLIHQSVTSMIYKLNTFILDKGNKNSLQQNSHTKSQGALPV